MTDGRDVPPLSEDDIAAIAKRAAEEAARLLTQTEVLPHHPAPPAGAMTGRDLRSLQTFDPDIGALERAVGMMLHGKLSNFMTREQTLDLLDNRTHPFLTAEQIRTVIHKEMEDDATIRAAKLLIRGAAIFVGLGFSVGKKVGVALAIYFVWAFLKWAGLKDLPSPPGIWE